MICRVTKEGGYSESGGSRPDCESLMSDYLNEQINEGT